MADSIMYLEKLGAIKSQAVLQMEKENKKEESGGLIRDILKVTYENIPVYCYSNVQADMWINSNIPLR